MDILQNLDCPSAYYDVQTCSVWKSKNGYSINVKIGIVWYKAYKVKSLCIHLKIKASRVTLKNVS